MKYNVERPNSFKDEIKLGDLVEWTKVNEDAGVCVVMYNGILSLKDTNRFWSNDINDGSGVGLAKSFILNGRMEKLPKGTKVTLIQD